jgi:hypothetical protein
MFTIVLRHDEHIRRYAVYASPQSGWEATCEDDRHLTRQHYEDWHRVERVLAVFRQEVSELTASGWRIAGDESQSA